MASTPAALHSGYFHPVLRHWQATASGAAHISAANLMLPVFVVDEPDARQPIASMPGVDRVGVNTAVATLQPLVKQGLKAVLLFAVTGLQKVNAHNRGGGDRQVAYLLYYAQ